MLTRNQNIQNVCIEALFTNDVYKQQLLGQENLVSGEVL